MNAQPRPLSSVQADQILADLEVADRLRLDDLPTHAADLDDRDYQRGDLDDDTASAS